MRFGFFFDVVYLINKLFPCPSLASQFFTISEPKNFAQVPANGHKSSIHLLLLIDFESTRDGIDKRKLCWFTISYINVVSPGVGLLCVLRKNKKRASSSRDRKARESIKLLCPVKLMFYVFLNWESFFFFCSFAFPQNTKIWQTKQFSFVLWSKLWERNDKYNIFLRKFIQYSLGNRLGGIKNRKAWEISFAGNTTEKLFIIDI